MFRPLAFDFPEDAEAAQVEDQLFLGNELMIAPIYKQNAQGRYVYLPEEMMLVRMKSYDNYETEILPKGHHYVPVALDELVFFIRNQKAIPFAEPAESTAKTDLSTLRLLGYADASYELYTDNGVSPDRKTASWFLLCNISFYKRNIENPAVLIVCTAGFFMFEKRRFILLYRQSFAANRFPAGTRTLEHGKSGYH